MDRKIVKPAMDGGRIWSPEHRRFLPAEGMEVEMTPFWVHLMAREDVTATAVPDPEEAAEAPAEPEVASEASTASAEPAAEASAAPTA